MKIPVAKIGAPARALLGIVSAGFGLGVGELAAGVTGQRSPLVSVGDRVIDGVPASVKKFAIRTFGTSDKTALIVGVLIITALMGAVVGIRAAKSFRFAWVAVGLFVLAGSACALTGRLGKVGDVVPVLFAGVATFVALYVLIGRSRKAQSEAEVNEPRVVDAVIGNGGSTDPVFRKATKVDRRQFVAMGGGTALASVATAWIGRSLQSNEKATETRKQVTLPTPRKSLPAVQAVAKTVGQIDVVGMTPFFSPNSDFYRIDTALVVPRVDIKTWSLTIDGMVDRPVTLTYEDLQKREVVEHDCTLMCVSNEIGGDLVGNARWLGVRLADVLKDVGVKAGATQIFARSVDGFTAGFPTELAFDGREALLAFGMNGEPLPFAHGYPVRLVVPGIYGYVSAVKWLQKITLTTFEADQGYWIPRGWSAIAPIKTGSRIDVPGRSSGQLRAGRLAIAGVAWAQHRGIKLVEVQVDDGPWQKAELAVDGGIDTWRQWKLAWDATKGEHTIRVRATDATGQLQPEQRTDVAPDGATGWHTIAVNIL